VTVLQDALKVGFTKDRALISRVITQLKKQVSPLPHKSWFALIKPDAAKPSTASPRLRVQPAGHILGSVYLEVEATQSQGTTANKALVVFGGDPGRPPTPRCCQHPEARRADILVTESTLRRPPARESRKARRQPLQAICERAFGNRGTLLIPAFPIGRTQELFIRRHRHWCVNSLRWVVG
jgi:metallo-beta-lactamase family protein